MDLFFSDSSSLSRSKTAVLVATAVTAVVAACTLYYVNSTVPSNAPTSGLHRRNAIHRRRRGGTDRRRERSGTDTARDILTITEGGELGDEGRDRHGSDLDRDELGGPRNGQNILQLLFRVSEDATRKSAYVHRGCACNSCSMVPIRGTRYRCANCADFDLCEACEAQGLHTKTHVFYKVRIPASYLGPRQMQPVWYPGDPENCLRSLPKELVAKLSKETGFERPELDAYWEQFTFMASTEWREDPDELCLAMDRQTFDRAMVPSGGNRHVAPNLIHDRMFAFYDTNRDNLIGFPEFVNGLAYRRKKDKLRKIFEGYDINEDGYVDRKDFLRMFRSYYVLFKHMHEEVLEGLEEQALNSADALQLVTSRQPISSAFGRDGRFPQAPDTRSGEGKSVQANGDLYINDGLGVISETSNDHGDRNDTIVEAMAREFRRNNPPILFDNRYWATLVHPPLPDELRDGVLDGMFADRGDDADQIVQRARALAERTEDLLDENDDQDENRDETKVNGVTWPPVIVTQADIDNVCPGYSSADVPVEKRRDVIEAALTRLHNESIRHQARKALHELHDRWRRRQFYTDEEEGATPPFDWNEEEEVLIDEDKEPPFVTARSRSSSKVRFAEDTDDYEIRSNPSTSSRSVPERWGGMDIPDAERDAGKEILYQVSQQALNELLDQIFKKEEDLAIEVMSTKREREKYRRNFSTQDFVSWANAKDKGTPFGKVNLRPRELVYNYLRESRDVGDRIRDKGVAEPPPEHRRTVSETEVDVMRASSLDHVLGLAGYGIEEPVVGVDLMPRRAPILGSSHDARVREEVVAQMGNMGSEEVPVLISNSNYRDPTMPQFMPDTTGPLKSTTPAPTQLKKETQTSKNSNPATEGDKTVWWPYFLRLRRLQMLEDESERRSGWGRLTYEEFAKVLEGGDARIDYLGGWIDFCIPNGS